MLFSPGARRGRGRRREPYAARADIDAIRYLLKSGCQWSLLPKEFPPRSTVHDAFATWTAQGLWPRINTALRERVRVETLKNATPSAGIIDSQSVKGGQLPAASSGYDAGKKIKGRKRRTLTDTNGLLLGVVVTPASVQDRDGAKVLLCLFCHSLLSLLMIFADGGYTGKLEEFVAGMGRLFGMGGSFAMGIVKKLADQKGFVVLPRRWVIERNFDWLVKQRRLTRDHEKNPRHHEAFVYIAFIGVMTRRLTTGADTPTMRPAKSSLLEWIRQRQRHSN